ncbi:hypothetical protein [Dasania marina]
MARHDGFDFCCRTQSTRNARGAGSTGLEPVPIAFIEVIVQGRHH